MSGILLYVPVTLALLAEAAWIAVFAGLLEAFVLRGPVTGIPELLVAAAAGFLAARSLPRRVGGAWPWVALGLAATAGLLGWLSSAEARALLADDVLGGLAPALAANPGGWLAALALVRGIGYARLPVDPGRVGTTLAIGVPALAAAAVVGGMIAEPWRSLFLDAAQLWVLVFLGAAIPSLALARLSQVGRGAPVDWRRNPAWLALAGILVLATAGLAVTIALAAGHAIAVALAAALVPLLVIGFVVGFDRRSVRIVVISLGVVGAVGTILRFVAPGGPATIGGATLTPVVPDGQPEAGTGFAVGFFILLLVLGVIAALVLARLWLRRPPVATPDADETRVIDHGGNGAAPARRNRVSRFRRRSRPTDAVAAYRALLEDLDGRPPVAREPGETPAEHARRLRAAGHGGLGLDLLAADYGLVRYGGAALTPAETRRALGRAERLRQALRRVPVEAPEVGGIGVGVAGRPGAARGPQGVRGSRRGAGPGADLPDADQPGTVATLLTRIRRGP